ncbi:MAG: Flp family type IVb pilin [Thermodesulfobacteriota bacterium]|nr:Flp family type IVb pilin [Thermodesulfobacteriota bacterium]
MEKLMKFLKDEEGISSVEYAVLLAFIVTALITVVTALSNKVQEVFSRVTNLLT